MLKYVRGSTLVRLLFLIYIMFLQKTLLPMLFADGISLFSGQDTQTPANDINKGLEIISNWAFHWKINFNSFIILIPIM